MFLLFTKTRLRPGFCNGKVCSGQGLPYEKYFYNELAANNLSTKAKAVNGKTNAYF